MNPEFLVSGVLRSVLGGRRKRSRRALRYLTGNRGSFWSNPATLMTAAGVAWGIFDTLQATPPDHGVSPASSGVPAAGASSNLTTVPPPLPNTGGSPTQVPLSPEAQRIIRLAISAAYADGSINDHERAAVLQQAKDAGIADVVQHELQYPRALAEIVAGVSDPAQRATLYVLAFTIIRADEQVSGAERIYLAQLANRLGLDRQTVETLEKDTGERIDALGDQGQLGG
jgi:tellurite resistance protein